MAGNEVEYVFLGRSGLRVSNICLGTMDVCKHPETRPKPLLDEETFPVLDRYVELGGNFLDTADVYGETASEELIGRWLKRPTTKSRREMVISTKVRFALVDSPLEEGLGRKRILQACDDSLRRLNTNYIDLYQIHGWDYAVPIEETLQAFQDLVTASKVHYIGICNVTGWQLQKVVDTCRMLRFNKVISVQNQYSLLTRGSEQEGLQVCGNEGIAVVAVSPLKGGLLTGKFKRGFSPASPKLGISFMHTCNNESTAMLTSKNIDNDFYWNLMKTMDTIGRKQGKTMSQIAIRWLLQKNVVASVITRITTIAQLEDNMGAGKGWTLTEEEMDLLDEASFPVGGLPYPYGMQARYTASRINNFMCYPFIKNIV